jgi:hypothetical protein
MKRNEKAAGEGRISPAADALPSKALQTADSEMASALPPASLAATIVAYRHGLSMPWAELVAAAAGLGVCGQ